MTISISKTLVREQSNVHEDDIHGLIRLKSGAIVSGSKDTTTKVWGKTSLELSQTCLSSYRRDYTRWITALAPLYQEEGWVQGTRNGQLSVWRQDEKQNYYQFAYQFTWLDTATHKSKQRNSTRINCIYTGAKGVVILGLPTALQVWKYESQSSAKRSLQYVTSIAVAVNDWVYAVLPLKKKRCALAVGDELQVWKFEDEKSPSLQKQWKFTIPASGFASGQRRAYISSLAKVDGHSVIATVFGGQVKVFDMSRGEASWSTHEHFGRVWQAVSLDIGHTKIWATGADDRTVKLWDIREQKSIATLDGHCGRVSCLLPMSNQQLLAASCPRQTRNSSTLGTFSLWDLRASLDPVEEGLEENLLALNMC